MSGETGALSALLTEDRRFPPPEDFATNAVVSDPGIYERAKSDREAYWEEWARELDWFEPWHTVLDWKPPFAKWFLGGKINVSHNCLDRHLNGPRRDKVFSGKGNPATRGVTPTRSFTVRSPGSPMR
jgi:acetyl-CoA synthetase